MERCQCTTATGADALEQRRARQQFYENNKGVLDARGGLEGFTATRNGPDETSMVVESKDKLGHDEKRTLDEGVERFVSGLYRMDTPTHKASGRFEIEQTGPYNYRVQGGDTAIDIDGYDGKTMLDAKFVEKPANSPYVENSNVPEFLRKKILKEQQYEVQRYNEVIKDPNVPFDSLDILTNEPKAVPYFKSIMDKYQVPGSVKVVETEIPQVIPRKK